MPPLPPPLNITGFCVSLSLKEAEERAEVAEQQVTTVQTELRTANEVRNAFLFYFLRMYRVFFFVYVDVFYLSLFLLKSKADHQSRLCFGFVLSSPSAGNRGHAGRSGAKGWRRTGGVGCGRRADGQGKGGRRPLEVRLGGRIQARTGTELAGEQTRAVFDGGGGGGGVVDVSSPQHHTS